MGNIVLQSVVEPVALYYKLSLVGGTVLQSVFECGTVLQAVFEPVALYYKLVLQPLIITGFGIFLIWYL